MRTRIKFCGINQQTDFAYAAALGVDAVGLVFYPSSPRYIDIEKAQKLLSKVTRIVTTVALFMDASREFVARVLNSVNVDYLQFHGGESPTFCTSFSLPYIKAIPMADSEEARKMIAAHSNSADILLFDSHRAGMAGGTGVAFDWHQLPKTDVPIFIAGGLTPENVGQAIATCHPHGVDVVSGVESVAGVKDHIKMRAFVQAVLRADNDSSV
ncbi:MAG: phosphoribosylanthranilate isomerase [Chromatiales bacterium]|nr:phosphoribosylanthranilate isomerase [Chromatiales bacterium]